MTDQAPELLRKASELADLIVLGLSCDSYLAKMDVRERQQIGLMLLTRPPSERHVAQALAEQAIERQRVLGDPTGHVDALAVDLVLAGETEYGSERPEAGRENLTAEEFAQVLPHEEPGRETK